MKQLLKILNVVIFPIDFLLDHDSIGRIQSKMFNTIGVIISAFVITAAIFAYRVYIH